MEEPDVPTVLIVDDDESVADVYANQLADSYDVQTAYTGEEALAAISDEIDVVLLDRRMPKLTGSDVLETVRGRGLDCGVVMVTAVDPGFDIVDMGFDDYLLKPVSRDALESTVEETVDRIDQTEKTREYLAVASKLATLRMEKNTAQLDRSEEYTRLKERFERLREQVDTDDADVDVPVDI